MKIEEIRNRLILAQQEDEADRQKYKAMAITLADDDHEDRHLYTTGKNTIVYSYLHLPSNKPYYGITTHAINRNKQHLDWDNCYFDKHYTYENQSDWLYRELIDMDDYGQFEEWGEANTFNTGTKFVRYKSKYLEDVLIMKYNTTNPLLGYNVK